jgi:hypothetical protein
MRKNTSTAIMLVVLTALSSGAVATPVFKCTTRGSVSYQSVPCPSGPVGKRQTLEQLNAAEKLKLDGDRDGIPCEEQWCSGVLR